MDFWRRFRLTNLLREMGEGLTWLHIDGGAMESLDSGVKELSLFQIFARKWVCGSLAFETVRQFGRYRSI